MHGIVAQQESKGHGHSITVPFIVSFMGWALLRGYLEQV
jgi:hypothetical protein